MNSQNMWACPWLVMNRDSRRLKAFKFDMFDKSAHLPYIIQKTCAKTQRLHGGYKTRDFFD